MKYLTENQIKQLWEKYKVPENIKEHSKVVARLSIELAEKINKNGTQVNIEIVRAGALLHDIGKWLSIKNNIKSHEELGAKILKKEKIDSRIVTAVANHTTAVQNSN